MLRSWCSCLAGTANSWSAAWPVGKFPSCRICNCSGSRSSTYPARRWATSTLQCWKRRIAWWSCRRDTVDKPVRYLGSCMFPVDTVRILLRFPSAYRPHIRLCIPVNETKRCYRELKRNGSMLTLLFYLLGHRFGSSGGLAETAQETFETAFRRLVESVSTTSA